MRTKDVILEDLNQGLPPLNWKEGAHEYLSYD